MRFTIDNSMKNPYGGKLVILGGDFRQILLVVAKGSQPKIVMTTVNSSRLWKHWKVFTLNQNMRLLACNQEDIANDIKMFTEWILDISGGKVGNYNDGESNVEIPPELLLSNNDDPIGEIVASTYPNLEDNFGCVTFFLKIKPYFL